MRPQEVAKYSLEKDSKKSFDGSIYVFFYGYVAIRIPDLNVPGVDNTSPYYLFLVEDFNKILQIYDYIRCYGLSPIEFFFGADKNMEIGNTHKLVTFERNVSEQLYNTETSINFICSFLESYSHDIIFNSKDIYFIGELGSKYDFLSTNTFNIYGSTSYNYDSINTHVKTGNLVLQSINDDDNVGTIVYFGPINQNVTASSITFNGYVSLTNLSFPASDLIIQDGYTKANASFIRINTDEKNDGRKNGIYFDYNGDNALYSVDSSGYTPGGANPTELSTLLGRKVRFRIGELNGFGIENNDNVLFFGDGSGNFKSIGAYVFEKDLNVGSIGFSFGTVHNVEIGLNSDVTLKTYGIIDSDELIINALGFDFSFGEIYVTNPTNSVTGLAIPEEDLDEYNQYRGKVSVYNLLTQIIDLEHTLLKTDFTTNDIQGSLSVTSNFLNISGDELFNVNKLENNVLNAFNVESKTLKIGIDSNNPIFINNNNEINGCIEAQFGTMNIGGNGFCSNIKGTSVRLLDDETDIDDNCSIKAINASEIVVYEFDLIGSNFSIIGNIINGSLYFDYIRCYGIITNNTKIDDNIVADQLTIERIYSEFFDIRFNIVSRSNTIVQFTSSGSGMRCKGLDVGLTGVLLELTDFDGTEAFNIPLNWFREFSNIGDVTRVAIWGRPDDKLNLNSMLIAFPILCMVVQRRLDKKLSVRWKTAIQQAIQEFNITDDAPNINSVFQGVRKIMNRKDVNYLTAKEDISGS